MFLSLKLHRWQRASRQQICWTLTTKHMAPCQWKMVCSFFLSPPPPAHGGHPFPFLMCIIHRFSQSTFNPCVFQGITFEKIVKWAVSLPTFPCTLVASLVLISSCGLSHLLDTWVWSTPTHRTGIWKQEIHLLLYWDRHFHISSGILGY